MWGARTAAGSAGELTGPQGYMVNVCYKISYILSHLTLYNFFLTLMPA